MLSPGADVDEGSEGTGVYLVPLLYVLLLGRVVILDDAYGVHLQIPFSKRLDEVDSVVNGLRKWVGSLRSQSAFHQTGWQVGLQSHGHWHGSPNIAKCEVSDRGGRLHQAHLLIISICSISMGMESRLARACLLYCRLWPLLH